MDEKKLGKREFIERLAAKGYTLKDASLIVDDFISTIEEIVIEGNSIMFHGFGTFDSILRNERESTNVRTHEKITIPAFRCPKFTPGKAFKRSVRDGIIR